MEFEKSLADNQLSLGSDSNRWAFAALIASIHALSRLDLFILFKIFLPLFTSLIVLPLWLIARQLPHRSSQYVILLTAAISPTIILELEVIRAQSLFLVWLYFSLGFLAHAAKKRDFFLFFLAGTLSILGVFYHALFVVFLLAWLSVLLWHHRSFFLQRYKIFIPLIVIAYFLLRNKAFAINIFNRLTTQAALSINNFLLQKWNLSFPAQFTSDGLEVGWSGPAGILKYYAFYAGPFSLAFLLFLLLLILFFWRRVSPHIKQANYFHHPFFYLLFFFLVVAEIAPRFGGHAYLPDRAWQYISILLISPLFLFLSATGANQSRRVFFNLIGLTLILISIGGSLYVNHLISYRMPAYERAAATWIKANLPVDRLFFTSSSKYLLLYHTSSQRLIIDDSFLENNNLQATLDHINKSLVVYRARITAIPDKRYFYNTWYNRHIAEQKIIYDTLNDRVEGAIEHLSTLLEEGHLDQDTIEPILARARNLAQHSNKANDDVYSMLNEADRQLAIKDIKAHSDMSGEELFDFDSIYIYYARTHPSNPYSQRPYKSSFTVNHDFISFPTLDNNPDIFNLIYNDGGNVLIWEVNTDSFIQP